jgi:dihydroorotase
MLRRDIELAKYTGSKLHFTGVSTANGMDCIRKAKNEGLQLSCSVTPGHLYFSDEDLTGYDTNLKLSPPLRTKADRDALREAILDGTVDCIASHHLPHHTDHKVVEFEYAKPGMISLETAFAVVRTCLPDLSLDRLVDLFSANPRRLFQMKKPVLTKNTEALFTLFLPDKEWVPQRFVSRSRNSPFTGVPLTGMPYGIIQQDRLFLKPL